MTADAIRTHTVTLLSEPNIPAHIKHLMATSTAALKTTLARRIEALSTTGEALRAEEIAATARAVEPERTLDNGQMDGAAAIAGTSRSVAISGAAGTGKTTMLKVAGAAMRRRGHNMIIVAPTKKASAVKLAGAGGAVAENSNVADGWGADKFWFVGGVQVRGSFGDVQNLSFGLV